MIYLVRYIRPVITVESVWFTGSGFYVPGAVSFFLDVWIVKRINVDGKAKSVLEILVVEPVMKRKLNDEELLARIELSSSAS